jgi:hypothetical protein
MRGTGAVTIGKDVVYAYFSVSGRTARVRLSTDEADRLDLFTGKQVPVGFNGGEVGRALVTDVSPVLPFVWIEMELAALTSRAG